MSQISQVGATLKSLLKQQQLTYKDIAQKLSMSEANIKRIFSTHSYTLERLEEICAILSISLTDLFYLCQQNTEKLSQLTEEQENQLLANPKLLLVAVCVRDSWTFKELIEYYDIDQFECTRLLAKLDKLKIINLLDSFPSLKQSLFLAMK